MTFSMLKDKLRYILYKYAHISMKLNVANANNV